MLNALITFALLTTQPTPIQDAQDPQKREYRYIRSRQFQLEELQVVELKVGAKLEFKLHTWVMDKEAKRQEGMMFLLNEDVGKDDAMVFVFRSAQLLDFWMKNTFIPLDIAYLDAEGKIVKMYTMRALDIYSDYGSKAPAKYALEMKEGSIKRFGLAIGQKVEVPPTVKAKD